MLDRDRERQLREAGADFHEAERRRLEAVARLRRAFAQADGDVSIAEAAAIADLPTVAVYAFHPEAGD